MRAWGNQQTWDEAEPFHAANLRRAVLHAGEPGLQSLWSLVARLPVEGGTIILGPYRYALAEDVDIARDDVTIRGFPGASLYLGEHSLAISGARGCIEGCKILSDANSARTASIELSGEMTGLRRCVLELADKVLVSGAKCDLEGNRWPTVVTAVAVDVADGADFCSILDNRMDADNVKTFDAVYVGLADGTLIDGNQVNGRIYYPLAGSVPGAIYGTVYGDNVATGVSY